MVGDGTDINPSNACLSAFSRLSASGLWHKKSRKRKDTLLRAVCLAHTGLICLPAARVYSFFFYIGFGARKRRSKVSYPFPTAQEIRGIFLFFFLNQRRGVN